jgi:small-conductance mechanosensitive channel
MMVKNTQTPPLDDSDGALAEASARLNVALDLLDTRTSALLQRMKGAREAGEVDEDRARLAAELDAAQARADTLEEAAREAGTALDAAIDEVRSALGEV